MTTADRAGHPVPAVSDDQAQALADPEGAQPALPTARRLLQRAAAVVRLSFCRTVYHTARAGGGLCLVMRGTRIRLGRGAQIRVTRGSRLVLGSPHFTGRPCTVHLRAGARLTARGSAAIMRGTKILVSTGGHLELGQNSYINFNATVTCFEHISIGADCAIAWNTNILDANIHELIIDGAPRPRSRPISIGDNVWIGTGASVLSGVTIGDGAVVAACSVVTSDVPARSVVAGNPARVVREDVTWCP